MARFRYAILSQYAQDAPLLLSQSNVCQMWPENPHDSLARAEERHGKGTPG
jgi:hypothetical protein